MGLPSGLRKFLRDMFAKYWHEKSGPLRLAPPPEDEEETNEDTPTTTIITRAMYEMWCYQDLLPATLKVLWITPKRYERRDMDEKEVVEAEEASPPTRRRPRGDGDEGATGQQLLKRQAL